MAFQEQDRIDGWSDYTSWINNLIQESSVLTSSCIQSEPFKHDLRTCNSNCDRVKLFWQNPLILGEIERLYSIEKKRPFPDKNVLQVERRDFEEPEPGYIEKPHATLKNASELLDCVYTPDKGRHMVAKRTIPPGTLVVAEEPFVCILSPEMEGSYCHNCLALLSGTKTRCSSCTRVAFCSDRCLQAAKDIHSYECEDLLKFHQVLGPVYIVMKIMFKIQFNFNRIIIHSNQGPIDKSLDETLALKQDDFKNLHYTNSYASVLLLQDHAEDYDINSMIANCITSIIMTLAMKDSMKKKISESSDPNFLITFSSVLLRHVNQLQINLVSVLFQDFEGATMTGARLTNIVEYPIGVGIYPTIALFNHSCDPSLTSLFKANRYEARTTRKLEAGQEVAISYGPTYVTETKKDRQAKLKSQYFFECKCQTCVENKENEALALLCPRCKGPVFYSADFANICHQCQSENVINVIEYLGKLNSITGSLNKLRTDLESTDKLEQLGELQKNLEKIVFWRHCLFVDLKHELTVAAAAYNDSKAAMQFSKDELELSIKNFGENSLETVSHRLTIIHYHWDMLESQQGKSLTESEKIIHFRSITELLKTIETTANMINSLLDATDIPGSRESMEVELNYLANTHEEVLDYLELQKSSGPSSNVELVEAIDKAYQDAKRMERLLSSFKMGSDD